MGRGEKMGTRLETTGGGLLCCAAGCCAVWGDAVRCDVVERCVRWAAGCCAVRCGGAATKKGPHGDVRSHGGYQLNRDLPPLLPSTGTSGRVQSEVVITSQSSKTSSSAVGVVYSFFIIKPPYTLFAAVAYALSAFTSSMMSAENTPGFASTVPT